jgi:hypothetical protein
MAPEEQWTRSTEILVALLRRDGPYERTTMTTRLFFPPRLFTRHHCRPAPG